MCFHYIYRYIRVVGKPPLATTILLRLITFRLDNPTPSMAHTLTVEGQLRKILKELLEFRQESGNEYHWKLLSHFHLLETNVLVNMRYILGCRSLVVDETPRSQQTSSQDSHGMNVVSLLRINPDDNTKGFILNSGYKIYVPLLKAAVESMENEKIIKLLKMMDKKLVVALWFVACLAAKRKVQELVTLALEELVNEKNNVESGRTPQSRYRRIEGYLPPWKETQKVNNTGQDAETQRHLRPWRYTVLCFLVENEFSMFNDKIDKYMSLFLEDDNLNWVFHCMAAFGSTKKFTNYIDKNEYQKKYKYDATTKCSPLEVAVYHDNANFVKQFLQYPEFKTNIDELIQYAAMSDSTFTIKQLLEFQRNTSSNVDPSPGHQQAMPSTSNSNDPGVKVNEGDTIKRSTLTPLQLAALSGHANIIKILRAQGKQERNAKCVMEGETKSVQLLWPILQWEDMFVQASYELEDKIDDWMPGSSLDLWKCDRTQVLQRTSVWYPAGFTALHFAVVFGGTECVTALLEPNPEEWPIDVYAEDGEGLSPYDWAIAVDERNNNKGMQECLKPYVDLHYRPNGGSNERMRRVKAGALYERARKSYKERKQVEWVDSMSMALFRRDWDEARYLAKRVVSMDGLIMDDDILDDDGAVVMLQAMEAARKTIFQEYEILSRGGTEFSYTLLPNKIAAEVVLRELLRRLIKRDPKVDVSERASQWLSLAMKYGMEELAVDLVTLANCDVLSNGHFQVATEKGSSDAMPRLLMAMEQRKDVRNALYEERQVYVDYANTLLVVAALVSALAYQGWLQPPMGYGDHHELTMDLDHRRYFMLVFTYANNYGFTFSVGTMLIACAAIVAAPLPTEQIAHTKQQIISAVLCASFFLACSVTCVVVAFTCAESTILSHHYVAPQSYFVFNMAFTFYLLLFFVRRLYMLSFLQPLSRRVWKYLVRLFATIVNKCKKKSSLPPQEIPQNPIDLLEAVFGDGVCHFLLSTQWMVT